MKEQERLFFSFLFGSDFVVRFGGGELGRGGGGLFKLSNKWEMRGVCCKR